jgi:hypothetical protein
MARVKIHIPCQLPLAECGCPPDEDDTPDAPATEPEDGGED